MERGEWPLPATGVQISYGSFVRTGCDRGEREIVIGTFKFSYSAFVARTDFLVEMNRDNIRRPVNYDSLVANPTAGIVKKRLNLDRRDGRTALPCTFINAVSCRFLFVRSRVRPYLSPSVSPQSTYR